jgi:hypothetical protein
MSEDERTLEKRASLRLGNQYESKIFENNLKTRGPFKLRWFNANGISLVVPEAEMGLQDLLSFFLNFVFSANLRT